VGYEITGCTAFGVVLLNPLQSHVLQQGQIRVEPNSFAGHFYLVDDDALATTSQIRFRGSGRYFASGPLDGFMKFIENERGIKVVLYMEIEIYNLVQQYAVFKDIIIIARATSFETLCATLREQQGAQCIRRIAPGFEYCLAVVAWKNHCVFDVLTNIQAEKLGDVIRRFKKNEKLEFTWRVRTVELDISKMMKLCMLGAGGYVT
jgi:hypothetical protein